jgi:hypothetical protein
VAENIIFPHFKVGISDASGVYDVTLPPYNADKTAQTDVTAKLQQAYLDHPGWGMVYLPNGTYLVSNTISFSPACVTGGAGNGPGCGPRPILQGQSRKGTVIKLASGTFTNASSPKPVVFTGDGVAQEFNRGVHNLTILVGPNNAGANGIYFYGNNEALMSDVDIISQDGNANIGIDLGGGEQGPSMVARAYVQGFKTGIRSGALNGVTLSRISLRGQTVVGIDNYSSYLWIDSLTSTNTVTAVQNTANMTLINAFLSGGSSTKTAVTNQGNVFFARNITAAGYQRAFSSNNGTAPAGLTVDEFCSRTPVSLWTGTPARSMNLPIRRPPEPEWEQDTTKWGNIEVYKGGLGIRLADNVALQKAIDDPKNTVIELPSGRQYQIDDTIYVRGNIRRIIGTGTTLAGAGAFVIDDQGTAPVVKIEKINFSPFIHLRTSRTVVLQEVICENAAQGSVALQVSGPGDLFMESVIPRMRVSNARAHVWAWHYNAESSYSTPPNGVTVDAGFVWIFGWKTEGTGCKGYFYGGATELLGFEAYADCNNKSSIPLFTITNADFCVADLNNFSFCGGAYSMLARETRSGTTKTLSGGDAALYAAYDPTRMAARVDMPVTSPQSAIIKRAISRLIVGGSMQRPGHSGLYDIRGRLIAGACAKTPGVLILPAAGYPGSRSIPAPNPVCP